MPLVNCKISLILNRSVNSVINKSVGAGTLTIIDTKLYALVVTLLTENFLVSSLD